MGIGRFSWFCHRVPCLTYLLHCKDEKCRWKNISALHRSPLTVLESLLETVQMLDHCVSTIINDHCEVCSSTDKPFMRAEQKRTQRHHHLHSWKKVSTCLWLCQGSVLSVKGRSAYLHLTKTPRLLRTTSNNRKLTLISNVIKDLQSCSTTQFECNMLFLLNLSRKHEICTVSLKPCNM